jgi:hypothetical protein
VNSEEIIRKSQRQRRTTTCGCCATAEADTIQFSCDVNHEVDCHIDEPQTVHEAIHSKHAAEWRKAMDIEIGNMVANDVWEVIERPKDLRVVGSK